ncbi:hypothetical protein RB298_10265, partial [Priestia sp. BR_2]
MTYTKNILDMHSKCWDLLINIQLNDDSFYFVPRKINNANRLEQGYFFIGDAKYLLISFWNGGDTLEKIHNISWGVENNGKSFIELSAKDDANKAKFLSEMVPLLEQKTEINFKELSKWKWKYYYPKHSFYLDTLQSFIRNQKPIIDKFIRDNHCGIKMLDQEFNEKHVLKLINKYGKKQSADNETSDRKKKEGQVLVSPSDYIISFQHNELQNSMYEYLKHDRNIVSVDLEVNNIDIVVKTASKEKIYYELKTCDVKLAIRLAIGQLLEYAHFPDKNKADKLVIVTKYEPKNDEIIY